MKNIIINYLIILLVSITSVKGLLENYPPGLSCINGTTTPNTIIFVHYNATESPGHHVDLIMHGERQVLDLDFPLNYYWERTVFSSSKGSFIICFDVNIDEGSELKEQPIDFGFNEVPILNKKIKPVKVDKTVYSLAERILKLDQLNNKYRYEV